MSETIEITNINIPLVDEVLSSIEKIPQITSSIAYEHFFSEYLVKNVPCVIHSDVTGSWPCRKEWVLNGAPNFEYLREQFGQCTVPVADCNRKYYNSQFKDDMMINKYLDYWIKRRERKESLEMPLLYLKDWHCVKTFKNLSIYQVPKYFASDWLNEYYIYQPELNDDYMFVYMGPKESWTPLHVDVFTSYSWSANIVGRKRWLLFPPGQENHLRDLYGQLAYDATSDELTDKSKYKSYDRDNVKCLEIIQEAGEMIFVPSGWHHQVWNLEDTISINHNWINGCNVLKVWNSLKKELKSVLKEVEDCREMNNWSEHCQLMLKASYGMDYIQFFEFISFIARRRLDYVLEKREVRSFKDFKLGINHCLFDLERLSVVLKDLISDAEEKSIEMLICKNDEANVLLNDIVTNLQSSYDNVKSQLRDGKDHR